VVVNATLLCFVSPNSFARIAVESDPVGSSF